MSKYTELVRELDARDWGGQTIDANIPGYPVELFTSPSGEYEVEISPVNGYDDGDLHEDSLHFFVNVFEYDASGDDRTEKGQIFSRKKDTAEAAVALAEEKIAEHTDGSAPQHNTYLANVSILDVLTLSRA